MPIDGERDRRIERQIFLRSLNIARPHGSAAQQLASAMHDQVFPAGTVIFKRGERERVLDERATRVKSGEDLPLLRTLGSRLLRD